MDFPGGSELEALAWIVGASLVAVVMAVIGLVRSGRAVPLSMQRPRKPSRAR